MSWRWRGVAYEYHSRRRLLYCVIRRVPPSEPDQSRRWYWNVVRYAQEANGWPHREAHGFTTTLRQAKWACEGFARELEGVEHTA